MRQLAILSLVAALVALPSPDAAAEPTFTPAAGSPGGYNPPKPKKGFKYPDCFCTDSTGRRVELGQTACLRIGSEQITARCDMSLNNPTWRRISSGCPSV